MLLSWILLLCFTAGQYLIYSHQHRTLAHSITVNKKPFQKTVSERCDFCDAMHHLVMLPGAEPAVPVIFSSTYVHWVAAQPGFMRIGLILASGRAPPVV